MVDVLAVQCTAEEVADTNDVLASEELLILICTDIASCVPAPWVSGKLEKMHIQTFFPKIKSEHLLLMFGDVVPMSRIFPSCDSGLRQIGLPGVCPK